MARKKVENKKALSAPQKLKILMTIVNRNKSELFASVIESFNVNFQSIIYARGTAPNDILDVLGVDNAKAVIVSIITEDKVSKIMELLTEKYFNKKNGKGVSFSIPMSSIIGVNLYQFLANYQKENINGF